MKNELRIVLVDDHEMMREGLRLLIESEKGLAVVGEACNATESMKLVRQLQPDVAVLDLSSIISGGIMIADLAAEGLATRFLALTADEDRSYLQQMFSWGVLGFVRKRSGRDELIRAIRTIALGIRYLDPAIVVDLVNDTRDLSDGMSASRQIALTDREEEVLRFVAQGFSNKEIGIRLGISVKTVETHKSRSMNKLGLRGRADLVRFAVERNWLQ